MEVDFEVKLWRYYLNIELDRDRKEVVESGQIAVRFPARLLRLRIPLNRLALGVEAFPLYCSDQVALY